jgi:hypothetical protein
MAARRPSIVSLVLVVALSVIGFVSPVRAQSGRLPGRIAVSGTVGVFRPTNTTMSDVYGNRLMPVTAQVDVRLLPDVAVFGGVRWMSGDGQSVVIGTPVVNETSATSLDVTAFRIGAEVAKAVTPRWALAAGAGVVFARYDELWPAAGLSFNNHSSGLLVLAEARYAVGTRWGVIGRVEYASVRADVPDQSSAVNLGGVDMSAGLRFAF